MKKIVIIVIISVAVMYGMLRTGVPYELYNMQAYYDGKAEEEILEEDIIDRTSEISDEEKERHKAFYTDAPELKGWCTTIDLEDVVEQGEFFCNNMLSKGRCSIKIYDKDLDLLKEWKDITDETISFKENLSDEIIEKSMYLVIVNEENETEGSIEVGADGKQASVWTKLKRAIQKKVK